MANCRFCDRLIEWGKNKGGWFPYDQDGTDHRKTCDRAIANLAPKVPVQLPKQPRKYILRRDKKLPKVIGEVWSKDGSGRWVRPN